MINYLFHPSTWMPGDVSSLPANMPSFIELLPSIYYAIILTFIRYYISDTIFTWIGIRGMGLYKYSLIQHNKHYNNTRGLHPGI